MPSPLLKQMLKLAKSLVRSTLRASGYTIVNNDYNHTSTTRLDFILKNAFSGDSNELLIFDVGANVGLTTIHFKSLFPLARVYSFEAVPSTCLTLASNLERSENVSWHNLALGAKDGICRIYLREDSQWNSLVPAINKFLENQRGEAVDVRVTTIDNFMANHAIDKIDLLKIDTEGYEMEVLKGASGALERGVVRSVLLEVGFDRQQLQHTHYIDIFTYLDEHGFRFEGLYEMSFDERNNIDFANALFYRGESL